MTLQDFAQGKGWVGISSGQLLCPDTRVCVLPAEVGSVRVGAGCQGELRVGKRRQEGSGIGGAAPPFLSVPGKFISSAPLQARQVALLTLSPHPPSVPGLRLPTLGTGSDRSAVGWSSPSVWGKVPGELWRLTVCAEREVAPGDLGHWVGRPDCGWSGELQYRRWGISPGIGEDRAGSVTLGGLKGT